MSISELMSGTTAVPPQAPAVQADGATSCIINDDDFYDIDFVCRYFGGPASPLHPTTVYRRMNNGIIPRPCRPSPKVNRWLGREIREARQAIIDAPRNPLISPRNRGKQPA